MALSGHYGRVVETGNRTSDAQRCTDDLVRTLQPTRDAEPSNGVVRFLGKGSQPDGLALTYGGHFLGQAVAAAHHTVEPGRRLHSLHSYFLRAGRHGETVTYDVEATRDGRSFSSRRVQAWQETGRICFEMTASFTLDEPGLARGFGEAPAALSDDPEGLPTYRYLMEELADVDPFPMPLEWAFRDCGIDIRPVNAAWHPNGLGPDGSINQWIRAAAPLPDDSALHAAVLAYQSDESLADTVHAPFDLQWGAEGATLASLDHAMWFHHRIDLNQWIYVEQRPVVVEAGRGLTEARMWNRAGQLVASANQEVLLRP